MNDKSYSDDEILDRLVREAGTPSSSPDPHYAETLKATILGRVDALTTAEAVRLSDKRQQAMRFSITGLAAAIAFVMVVVGAVVWFHGSSATFAFADFIQPILTAKTAKYKQTIEIEGQPARTITSQWMVLDAKRSRMEIADQYIHITDWSKGKSLSLMPVTRHATILEYADTKNASNDPSMWLRLLQMAGNNKTKDFRFEPLGEREFDGCRAMGFRISVKDGRSQDLWGDPKTGLPVRVEMSANNNTKVVISDFVFNADMDESLFSVEPPAGYTVDYQKADTRPHEEKDLIEMFRQYTKLCHGVFPDSLDSDKVTWTFWKTYHTANIFGMKELDEKRRHEFEEQAGNAMEELHAATTATAKLDKEQIRKLTDKMTGIVNKFAGSRTTEMTWKAFAPEKFKATNEQKQQFEKLVHKLIVGGTNKDQTRGEGEELLKLVYQMLWENLAPVTLKKNDKKRLEFESLMSKIDKVDGKSDEKQKIKEQFRMAFGDPMLADVEAWQAQIKEDRKTSEAKILKDAEDQKTQSQAFMDAQGQVGRGVEFANQLQPAADAQYVGKGITFGTPNRPVFWYKPTGAENYHVIYADLSVKELTAAEVKNLSEKKPQ
jgi:outer membrane lipoprotein-sorting protein